MFEMINLQNTNCLEFLKTLADNSIDAVITDPPYGMSQHSQQDIINALTAWLAGEEYQHGKKGFMNNDWDSFVPSPMVWKEVLRVLKPGGHILCAVSSRTSDLMGISLRLAGFEIRDTIEWLYGSGFPKSVDISKAIDKAAGVERTEKYIFTGVDGRNRGLEKSKGKNNNPSSFCIGEINPCKDLPATPLAKQFDGIGTALKPAHEPFILARKPIEKGLTIAQNCVKWGTGGLDINGCRIDAGDIDSLYRKPTERKYIAPVANMMTSKIQGSMDDSYKQGRFPANVIHSGDACVVAVFPNSKSTPNIRDKRCDPHQVAVGSGEKRKSLRDDIHYGFNDSGSAARFFYCAKASQSERNNGGETKNHHPTVKPLALMEYLIKLISREWQTVLDPFMGSGTTGVACKKLNRRFVGVELHTPYFEIATARIKNTEQDLINLFAD